MRVCRHWHPPTLSPYLSAPTLSAASLELKAEKENAHSDYVRSVAFSPDGKTIVSGSYDKTLKVWDAGVLALTTSNPYHPLDLCDAGKKHLLLWLPHTATILPPPWWMDINFNWDLF